MAPVKDDNLLWRRVAALRGIQGPKRGERPHISGERFHAQMLRAEEKARRNGSRRTPPPPTRERDAPTFTPIGLRRALIQMEAARTARRQRERSATARRSSAARRRPRALGAARRCDRGTGPRGGTARSAAGAARADGRQDLVEARELGRPVVAAEEDLGAAVVEDQRVTGARVDVDLGERGARRRARARRQRGERRRATVHVVGAVEREEAERLSEGGFARGTRGRVLIRARRP